VTLRDVIAQAVQQAAATTGAVFGESEIAVFHPDFPNPTHRIS
jgi:hypothetical protein